MPPYVPRDYDDSIRKQILDAIAASDPDSGKSMWDQFVFLSGPSKCGKSRSLLHALAELANSDADAPDFVIHRPHGQNLDGLLARIRRLGLDVDDDRVKVVLIDDLQFYVGPLELSRYLAPLDQDLPRLAELLMSPGPERIVGEVVDRFGDRDEAAIAGRVAAALVNKGVVLGVLGRSGEEVAVYGEVVDRFGDRDEAAIAKVVATAERALDLARNTSRLGADDAEP